MRGEEPGADRSVPNLEFCCDLSQAVSFRSHVKNPVAVYSARRATQLLAILSRIPNPGAYTLPDQVALQLRHR